MWIELHASLWSFEIKVSTGCSERKVTLLSFCNFLFHIKSMALWLFQYIYIVYKCAFITAGCISKLTFTDLKGGKVDIAWARRILRGQSENCVDIAWAKRTVRGRSGHSRGHGVGKADSAWTKWAFAWTLLPLRTWATDNGELWATRTAHYTIHTCVYIVYIISFSALTTLS